MRVQAQSRGRENSLTQHIQKKNKGEGNFSLYYIQKQKLWEPMGDEQGVTVKGAGGQLGA